MNILSHIFGKCMFMLSTRVELLVTENLFCMAWGRDQDCFPCGYTIDMTSLMKSSGLSQCASGLKSKAIIVRVCITVFFVLFLMQLCYFSFSWPMVFMVLMLDILVDVNAISQMLRALAILYLNLPNRKLLPW